mmetsp:Transcript_10686/g.22693  ORF Transcript_10686/g.22693 Transcript_10686/m.22693 type:complete len:299 (-) Transcript_10686:3465-4361(-)
MYARSSPTSKYPSLFRSASTKLSFSSPTNSSTLTPSTFSTLLWSIFTVVLLLANTVRAPYRLVCARAPIPPPSPPPLASAATAVLFSFASGSANRTVAPGVDVDEDITRELIPRVVEADVAACARFEAATSKRSATNSNSMPYWSSHSCTISSTNSSNASRCAPFLSNDSSANTVSLTAASASRTGSSCRISHARSRKLTNPFESKSHASNSAFMRGSLFAAAVATACARSSASVRFACCFSSTRANSIVMPYRICRNPRKSTRSPPTSNSSTSARTPSRSIGSFCFSTYRRNSPSVK